ncbi:hypothetical protein PLUTE_b1125 [Pseudoalteromonas luteoviolacea DSM 6061]|nr:hypothetical protein [Pseudoalteromonas luteoviolacea DSM 6061]
MHKLIITRLNNGHLNRLKIYNYEYINVKRKHYEGVIIAFI